MWHFLAMACLFLSFVGIAYGIRRDVYPVLQRILKAVEDRNESSDPIDGVEFDDDDEPGVHVWLSDEEYMDYRDTKSAREKAKHGR